MSHDIHLIGTINDLEARPEPYWGPPIESGRYLGVRKNRFNTCTWIARCRYRNEEGKQRQKYKSLGQCTKKFDHRSAKKIAEEWFSNFDAGISDEPPTVADVCREYIADMKADGRESAAKSTDMRFRRYVYDHDIGNVRLDKIRTIKLKAWRNGLGWSKSHQNRNWTALRAALNLAVIHRRVSPSVAQEWKAIKQHKKADKRRKIFLDLNQRRALLNACEGAVRDLVEAAALTGARPGDLSNATVGQFDARTGMMTFSAKDHERTVPVSDPAIALFKRLSKDKLPNAYLFTRDDGNPWQHRKWSYPVREAAAKAKLPKGVKLYTLRHSWITDAILGGMSTLEVSKLSGTSLQMIENHYGHLVHEAARKRLNQVTML